MSDAGAVESLESLLAAEIEESLATWVDRIVDRVSTFVPEIVADDAAIELAVASSRALLQAFGQALVSTDPPQDLRAPSSALHFARSVARSGASLAGLLRSYRLGQELLFGRAAELSQGADASGLRRVGLLTFRFVDAVMGEVTEVFEQEREAFLRGSALRRERMIARLLADDVLSQTEVEAALGWKMAGRHIAMVAWPDTGVNGATATQLRAVLSWLGDEHGLTMPGVAGEWYAWTRCTDEPGALPTWLQGQLAAARLRVAVGQPGRGLEGFVASRRQAEAARRMSRHYPDRTIINYRDVALPHLLLADHAAALTFADSELGALARASQDLKATVEVYLERACDATATAKDLGLHRNTVMRRIDRATEILGRPVDERIRETHAALLVTRTQAALNIPRRAGRAGESDACRNLEGSPKGIRTW